MNEEFPYRQQVYGCIHPETYKYYFEKHEVISVWQRLRKRYGEVTENRPFLCMQIECASFIFRSTLGGNPITVIRKHTCEKKHIDELHLILGFMGKTI